MKRTVLHLLSCVFAITSAFAGEAPQLERGQELIRTELRIAAGGLRAMALAAHPDDEDSGTLAYLRRELGVETHLCQFTRGEGGQNEIGPELGKALATLRTKETEAASRILGAKAWYLNLPDFGFSKSPEETFKVWNREEALGRLVRIIRIVRPHFMFMNHDPNGTDHGHHRAAGQLAVEAFDAAADPAKYAEHMKEDGTQPWAVSKLYFRRFAPVDGALKIELARRDPVTGRSASDIGALALLQHASQGMQRNLKAGESDPRYFAILKTRLPAKGKEIFLTDGLKEPELFLAPELNHGDEFPTDPEALAVLIGATIKRNPEMDPQRKKHLDRAVIEALGVISEATISDERITYDEDATVTLRVMNRGAVPLHFSDPKLLPESPHWDLELLPKAEQEPAAFAAGMAAEFAFKVRPKHGAFPNDPADEYNGSRNEERPLLRGRVQVRLSGGKPEESVPFNIEIPVPVKLCKERAFVIRPENVLVFDNPDSKDDLLIQGRFRLAVTNYRKVKEPFDYYVGLVRDNDAPVDKPSVMKFRAEDETAAREFHFMAPVEKLDKGMALKTAVWTAEKNFGGPTVVAKRVPLKIPAPLVVGVVRTFDSATFDALKLLEQEGLGLTVVDLTPEDVLSSDLNKLHTIVLDLRATQYRPEVRGARERLMQFMNDGGNVLCFYHKDFDWNDPAKGQPVRGAGFFKGKTGGGEIAPYPIELSFNRVTDENAAVRILHPEHLLMTTPNRIWQKDFEGWVQERSVYVPSKWDSHYTALLSSNDAGEPALDGGLLVADVGTGSFIYTSFVWFRQLRAGNAGAYRMLANMISYARVKRAGR